MRYSTTLQNDLEKWWKHLDCPMSVLEGIDDIIIGGVAFRPWGSKHLYHIKTKCTSTYLRTFQATEVYENSVGEQVFPIIDIYIDICNYKKAITYKKHRIHCSC